MGIETEIEQIISQVESNYWLYSDRALDYAKDRFPYKIEQPDLDALFPGDAEKPVVNTDIGFLTGGDRVFTPQEITGGFPVYEAPADIDWSGLYAALTVHKDRVWESAELDALIDKMQSLVMGDESWLTAEYQTNAFDLERDRRLQVLDDSLRLITSRVAARGFRIPTSMLTAQENEIIQKYQYDNSNESRELRKAVIEAARNFQQFAMEKGLSYEQINMGFTQAYNSALLEPIKLKVETYIKQLEASSEVFANKVKEIMLKFDAEIKSWELTGVYNENLFKAEAFPWDIYKTQIGAAATQAAQEVDMFRTKVDADVRSLVSANDSMTKLAQTGSSLTVNTKRLPST